MLLALPAFFKLGLMPKVSETKRAVSNQHIHSPTLLPTGNYIAPSQFSQVKFFENVFKFFAFIM